MLMMSEKVQCQIVVTTVDSKDGADLLARLAVEQRRAACAQISSLESIYHWQGKIEKSQEWRVEAKTTSIHVPGLMALWRQHHPYQLPEIIVLPIHEGLPDYLQWIEKETATNHS